MRVFLLTFLALVLTACSSPSSNLNHQGDAKVWSPHLFQFTGPKVSESREAFLDYSLDIEFTHEDGHSIWVIGYLSVVNDGAPSKWAAKFVPDAAGEWTYEYVFRHAPNIALNIQALNHGHGLKESGSGSFKVGRTTLDPTASDFRNKGMLQDVGARYLQFSGTKDYFLKTGAGSPENILAYADFDGTYDVGGTNFPALGENQLHEFEPHLKDVRDGDPTWGEGKGAAILGIANYYEEVGVNAQYLVTMNVEGDGQEVFPWVSHNDPYVFDVSKLAQWQTVFEHFNARGVLIDMLLAETENESWFEAFDGVEVGTDFADSRKLYYREMVARFGHLNGLVFNLGEEHGVVGNSGKDPYRQPTSVEQRLEFGAYIANIDPYNHAIVSHNWPDSEDETYGPKKDSKFWSGISLQAHHGYAEKVEKWSRKSYLDGNVLRINERRWMITVDEPLGWEYGAKPDSDVDDHSREIEGVLWPTLLAGGAGVDWYFGWQNNAPTSDLSNEDQRSRHKLWLASNRVASFMRNTVDLPTLESDIVEGGTIVATAKDKKGRNIKFTLERKKPKLPEGEGHHPWEYVVEGLAFERDGKVVWLNPMDPKL
jgi:hypothetical protein